MPAWLESVSPGHLSIFLARDASPRKSGLFIRHLCRCFPALFSDSRINDALDAADRHEAGEIEGAGYSAALKGAQAASHGATWAARVFTNVAVHGFYHGALSELRSAVLAHAGAGRGPRKNPVARVMRPVFFEHFGDPRSPVQRDPSWLTSTVVKMAEGMYASRDFGAMPILADALQDAGCEHADILDHCRSSGRGDRGEPVGGSTHTTAPHVRGCWVVDLLLGKS